MSRLNWENANKIEKVGGGKRSSTTNTYVPKGIKRVEKKRRFCAKFAGTCRECNQPFSKGEMIIHNFTTRKTIHEGCK